MARQPIKVVVTIRLNPGLRILQIFDMGVTRQAMSEELNAFSAKALTQVRRHLVHQTKLTYGYISGVTSLQRSWAANLETRIRVKDAATSLGRYMTWFSKRPKSTSWRAKGWVQRMRLRVWSGLQGFPVNPAARPFVMYPDRKPYPLIAVRTGPGKKVKVLSGPVLAGSRKDTGEVSRLETKEYIDIEMPVAFAEAINNRIRRIIAARTIK